MNKRGNRCRNWFADRHGLGEGWYDDPCLCPQHNTQENRINSIEWVKAKPDELADKYPYIWMTKEEAGEKAL